MASSFVFFGQRDLGAIAENGLYFMRAAALSRHCAALAACTRRRQLLSSSAGGKKVAMVYGSFCRDRNSQEDAESFYEQAVETSDSLRVLAPVAGNEFDFNSLTEVDALVVSASSWFGHPPPELQAFTHQLLLTAETNPGCLSHLQHAVWGNGDPRWFDTFMNVPRYIDKLLEVAGSRRFYARGEFGEPHAQTGADRCEPDEWAAGMWQALVDSDASQPQVPWDAQWQYLPSPHHHKLTEWDLRTLVKKSGALDVDVTTLARPGAPYFEMLEAVAKEVADERAAFEAEREERRRARSER